MDKKAPFLILRPWKNDAELYCSDLRDNAHQVAPDYNMTVQEMFVEFTESQSKDYLLFDEYDIHYIGKLLEIIKQ